MPGQAAENHVYYSARRELQTPNQLQFFPDMPKGESDTTLAAFDSTGQIPLTFQKGVLCA